MALALWVGLAALALRAVARGEPGSEQPRQDYVIDLLDALNVTCSVRGVTRAVGPVPDAPAWEFHPRVPRLTLARDNAVSLLAGAQDALGFHFVARQRRGSGGTLVALVSPAATARDGRALLQLVSSAHANQLRLDYRAGPAMQPASLLFPGGSPFAHGRWARLALDLRPRRLVLFVDCRRAVLLERGGLGVALNLQLPRDLQITFASLPGDLASKFLGYWQTAEISPHGFPRRPWHCENLADPFPLPQSLAEERYLDELPLATEPPALADIHNYQHQPSEPEFAPGGAQPDPPALEERMRQVEERVAGLGAGLDTVKAQSSELLARVKSLEGCECRRPGCTWDGTHREEGAAWDKDDCTACVCLQGEVRCSARGDRPRCLGCSYGGQLYGNGETFAGDACTSCRCWDGEVSCVQTACPALSCAQPMPGAPGQCCPHCQAGCEFEGQRYQGGDVFLATSNPCLNCSCLAGEVSCERLEQSCPPAPCSHPGTPRGQCCPACHACEYEGRPYRHGETFAPPGSGPCVRCTCSAGHVRCQEELCPPAPCAQPVRDPQHCCPICKGRGMCPGGANGAGWGEGATPGVEWRGPRQGRGSLVTDVCPPGCSVEGAAVAAGERFLSPRDPCQLCVCADGDVRCSARPCPAAPCAHPLPGSCCPSNCNGCSYAGKEYPNGAEFPHPTDPCKLCRCLSGNVPCLPRRCPPLLCAEPVLLPGGCCPQCPEPPAGCLYAGVSYQHTQRFYDPADACRHCLCANGTVTCQRASPRPPLLCSPLRQEAPAVPAGCLYEAQELPDGEQFPDPPEPCRVCTCWEGSVSCRPTACPPLQCPLPRPGPCCQACQGCEYLGQRYLDGQEFPNPLDTCGRCACLRGFVTCAKMPCDPPGCRHPARPPGQCCPLCQGCHFHGRACGDGETFPDPREPCRLCTCLGGDVLCVTAPCPPDLPPPADGARELCPRCRGCVHEGREHADGARWFSSPCVSCLCADSVATCARLRCLASCLSPVRVPGECCPLCAGCEFEGRSYSPGESFQPALDPCEVCTCELLGAGGPHVRCHRRGCPSLVGCARSHIQPPGPHRCCPTCTQSLSPCTAELAGTELRTPSDPCDTCRCQDLTWVCVRQACPQLRCPPAEQFTPPGACCPACNECEIEAGGRRVSDGESWTDTADECVSCTCNLGHVQCRVVECQPAECQGGLRRVRMPGSCCYECQDADGACSAQGQRYQAGERWQVDACTTCTCVSGEVNCRSQRCPPAACSADEAPALTPGMCCPRCLPRPATCLAFGDPHYRTFDGRLLHFQGACTYVLAQDCEGGDFSIHVTNEDRGRPGVSWTQEVTVRLGELVVQLLQDSLVRVAGQAVTLPFLREPQLSVQRQASGVLLSTHIGVKVLWSGRSQLEVSVPGSYRARTCGLCGDFNGHWQDDARLRSGRLARSEAAFGNSWKVQSDDATGGPCADGRDLDPCKEAGYRARKEANARCQVLTSGAFRPCHPLVPPQPFFAACAYDLCACGAGADADACLCEVLEAYATLCRRAGLALRWRSPTLCAVGCPQDRGYVFDDCGPPCPKTCFNKDAPLGDIESRCFKACVPGCQCPAGLVEHESRCIPPEACPRVVYSDP
ncbi:LOW QUALITY PROTEIN: kielin/chordin-like protein [Emydura macquarii macquarii]|uniref:LOW QUALITY PROTEIN: kielin/chordin-like protein n=1 Tax=Emydura macquarii macquarii TaxID=1129001 RepID=UPI00352B0E20